MSESSNGQKFKIPVVSLGDIFSTQEQRDEQARQGESMQKIPLAEISEFPNHPFQVRADEENAENG